MRAKKPDDRRGGQALHTIKMSSANCKSELRKPSKNQRQAQQQSSGPVEILGMGDCYCFAATPHPE